ncbi:hypothetical protein G7Y89_g11689 [Cudoniella acicularis]|uniref:Uncharacterized protein n=1 Tax=Cudoniella acicularis TaxID=354080 RepID=A0A8H4RD05_9HELO|nr:hypothetical protein G7Y89_g11689 [Cudoniella acicularis]
MSGLNANEARAASTTTALVPLTTIFATPEGSSTPATEANQIPTNIIVATGTPTNYIYSTASSASSSTSVASPSSGPGVSTVAKVTIGLSIPLVCLALLFGILFLFRRRKQKILKRGAQRPQYELGFSPAPTHTTFGDQKLGGGRVDSRSDIRNGSRRDSRMDYRRDSRTEKSRNESRTDSRSTSRLESRFNSRNSTYKSSISPSVHISELASPDDIAPAEHTIYEIGPGKEVEPEVDSEPEIEVASIVELPDTSRRSVKNWGRNRGSSRATEASRESMPTRPMPTRPPPPRDSKTRVARDRIPERPVYDGEGYDEEVNISWLAPTEPATPTSARFA